MDGQKPSLCISLSRCQDHQLVHLDQLDHGCEQGDRSDQDSDHPDQTTIFFPHLKHLPRFVYENAISHYGGLRDHSLDVS